MLSLDSYAQVSGIIKFFGITVDGPRKEFIHKLKCKGFEPGGNHLEGEILGMPSSIYIKGDPVYQVMITNREDNMIFKYFNSFKSYFENNPDYMSNQDIYNIMLTLRDESSLRELKDEIDRRSKFTCYYQADPEFFRIVKSEAIHNLNKDHSFDGKNKDALATLIAIYYIAENRAVSIKVDPPDNIYIYFNNKFNIKKQVNHE